MSDIPDVSQEIITRFIRAFQRMCGCLRCCPKCPLYGLLCGRYNSSISEIKEAITIIEAWTNEHPEKKRKTYAKDFREHFGHSWNNKDNNWQCRGKLYNDNADCVNSPRYDCKACWNAEMEGEDEHRDTQDM